MPQQIAKLKKDLVEMDSKLQEQQEIIQQLREQLKKLQAPDLYALSL